LCATANKKTPRTYETITVTLHWLDARTRNLQYYSCKL